MPDYKKMYFMLFGEMSRAIEILKRAQQEAEEMVMSTDDAEDETISSETIKNRL